MNKLDVALCVVVVFLFFLVLQQGKSTEKFEEDEKAKTIGIIRRLRETIDRILGREIQEVQSSDEDELIINNSA